MMKLIDDLRKIMCCCKQPQNDEPEPNNQQEDPLRVDDYPDLAAIRQQYQNSVPLTKQDLELGQSCRFHFQPQQAQYLKQLIQSGCSFSQACNKFNELFHTNLKANQIHQRWSRVENPSIKKGRWDHNEDCKLRQLVKQFAGNMQEIVKEMNGRTLLQIRKRMKILNLL